MSLEILGGILKRETETRSRNPFVLFPGEFEEYSNDGRTKLSRENNSRNAKGLVITKTNYEDARTNNP